MDAINRTFPNPEDFFDGPTDDELKQIEDELENISD